MSATVVCVVGVCCVNMCFSVACSPRGTVFFADNTREGAEFIVMKARLCGEGCLFKEDDKKSFEILDTFKGETLVGKEYEPLFPYFSERIGKSFRVVSDTYVTSDGGTGVVHQAAAHGEDDYRVCVAKGIVDKDEDVPCPISER